MDKSQKHVEQKDKTPKSIYDDRNQKNGCLRAE